MKESLFRALETFPGCVLAAVGVLLLIIAVAGDETPGMRLLGCFGGSVWVLLGATHLVSALRGNQQFFRRVPLPGPQVIVDDAGIHITERGRREGVTTGQSGSRND
jgi:hypothetical protein